LPEKLIPIQHRARRHFLADSDLIAHGQGEPKAEFGCNFGRSTQGSLVVKKGVQILQAKIK